MKTCSACKEEKEESCFCKNKSKKDGLNYVCKACANGRYRKWASENKEKLAVYRASYLEINKDTLKEKRRLRNLRFRDRNRAACKKYSEDNQEKEKARRKKYREEHKIEIREKAKEYLARNKEKAKEARKKYYDEHRQKELKMGAEYVKGRRKIDPVFAAKSRIRNLISTSIKNGGFKKRSKSEAILGCSIVELMAIWGISSIPDGFEIDHIVPMAQAQSEEEAIKLNHHTNLQLLPAQENYNKRDRPTEDGLRMVIVLLGREWIYKSGRNNREYTGCL